VAYFYYFPPGLHIQSDLTQHIHAPQGTNFTQFSLHSVQSRVQAGCNDVLHRAYPHPSLPVIRNPRVTLQVFLSSGLGLALNFQPSLIMLNRYFSEKRPLANGLAAAGSPVALCCLAPLGQVLQDNYGWRGGFLILGGILLNCCACGALMRPLVPPKKLEEAPPTAAEEQKPPTKKKLLDFSVFKDRGFLIYAVAASIMVLGLFVPPVFVVSYAKGLGYEDTTSALLLTILGFVDMFARPAAGLVAGLKWVRPRSVYLFSFAMFFNGITDIVGSQVTGADPVL